MPAERIRWPRRRLSQVSLPSILAFAALLLTYFSCLYLLLTNPSSFNPFLSMSFCSSPSSRAVQVGLPHAPLARHLRLGLCATPHRNRRPRRPLQHRLSQRRRQRAPRRAPSMPCPPPLPPLRFTRLSSPPCAASPCLPLSAALPPFPLLDGRGPCAPRLSGAGLPARAAQRGTDAAGPPRRAADKRRAAASAR